MRKWNILPALLFLALIINTRTYAQDLTIGVVEFEEKNSIGLENSGRIVAEWMVTELSRVSDFRISERLLMQKVLEEQQLMLSGVIDAEQVVEIGKIYGVDAIVTGSVMKVGETINITARIINVATGEVLKTASGRVENLADLERETYVAANNLADISREEFTVREAVAAKSHHRLDIGAGLGSSYDNLDYGSLIVDLLFRYYSPLFGIWVGGAPLPGIQSVELGGNINVSHYLGIAAAVGRVFDNEVDYVEATYVLAGIVGRPVVNIEFGLMFGATLSGVIWTESGNPVDVDGGFALGNYSVWVQYEISDQYSVTAACSGG